MIKILIATSFKNFKQHENSYMVRFVIFNLNHKIDQSQMRRSFSTNP